MGWEFLLALSTGEFLEALKWAAIIGTALGVAVGGYALVRTRDRRLKAVARQVGADILEDEASPDPPPLPAHLQNILTRLGAIPGQINTAILQAETRLGARLQPLVDMDVTLLRRMDEDRRTAHDHRQEVMDRIDSLGRRMGVLEGQSGRQEARDIHRENK